MRRTMQGWGGIVGLVGVTLAMLLWNGSAEARIIDFRFDEHYRSGDVLDFNHYGLSAWVTGGDEYGNRRTVVESNLGLGVYGGGGDSKDIDGHGPDEWLQIHFSQPVFVFKIDFERVDHSDETAIWVDGEKKLFGFIDEGLGQYHAKAWCEYDEGAKECRVGTWLYGQTFRFGDWKLDHNDDFRVEAMKLYQIPRHKRDGVVPEPDAAMAFGVGLLLVSASLRRRQLPA